MSSSSSSSVAAGKRKASKVQPCGDEREAKKGATAVAAAVVELPLPLEVLEYMFSFSDFDVMRAIRTTSQTLKKVADKELYRRSVAELDIAEWNCRFGYITAQGGWSERFLNEEMAFQIALKVAEHYASHRYSYCAYDEDRAMALFRAGHAVENSDFDRHFDADDVPNDFQEDVEWNVQSPVCYVETNARDAWAKFWTHKTTFGIEDDPDYVHLGRVLFGFFVNAKKVRYTEIKHSFEHGRSWKDGEDSAILVQTLDDKKYEIVVHYKRYSLMRLLAVQIANNLELAQRLLQARTGRQVDGLRR